jgi:hypothetical protein
MNKTMLLEKYPVYSVEVLKQDCPCEQVDDVLARLKDKIESHPVATYIGEFDHYRYIAKQAAGRIDETIQAAKHILFCVANAIPNPLIGAARPRAISVVEMQDKFVISFLEAPVVEVNQLMGEWVVALKNSS